MKRFKALIFLLLLLASFNNPAYSQQTPTSEYNYLVLYIETVDSPKMENLLTELRACNGKVISAEFIQSTAELFVTYTDAMRDDTIHQIVYKYFTQINKVRGTNIVEYE